jgi:hypothetical protein
MSISNKFHHSPGGSQKTKRAVQRLFRVLLGVGILGMLSHTVWGYSVLTHQAIIDSAWNDRIKPNLLQRFPNATEEQLRKAHAHAYGGAIIQDMGYYPFGSKFFSDLTHYARSGDFIEALITESRDLNEYAFALGALAHYAADNTGHPIGTNRAVPLVYPKLRARFGPEVTYADHPSSHIKTEFGFDVLQVARGRYPPESFTDFIGFSVSKELMERAFLRTYGLELKDVFGSLDLAIGTYRRAVGDIIPRMTRVAWETKKDEIEKLDPGITRERFVYNLSRPDYHTRYGNEYRKPGIISRTLSWILRVVPKVGPLKVLAFRVPTPEAEKLFIESFNATVERYRAMLTTLKSGQLNLENRDFDTGRPTRAGEYRLADRTYAKLLEAIEEKDFEGVRPELKENILAFYGDLNAPIATKTERKDWQVTVRALNRLRSTKASAQLP